jgi:endoglucanase
VSRGRGVAAVVAAVAVVIAPVAQGPAFAAPAAHATGVAHVTGAADATVGVRGAAGAHVTGAHVAGAEHVTGVAGQPDAGIAFPLHTSGASIVDANGKAVKLDFVNWYGAESPDYVVGGLEYEPISEIIGQIVSMGFNGVRLPWSNQLWESDPAISPALVAANPQFAGEDARTVFEQVVQDLASAGLMVILDDHNSDAEWCCSSTDGNTLWYNAGYPQSAWVSDWESVAAEFSGIPQVIGVDLRNEPRGTATWGGSASTDWQAAAELGGDAVQGVDPNLLIFVEGVNYALDLSGVASLPVTLTDPDHVVYEAHDYGFDHTGVTGYDDYVSQIQPDWGYLVGQDPLWVGEFGTCNTADSCVASTDTSDNGVWFSAITRYLGYHDVNWSYWPINGTESDGLAGQGRTYGVAETYGILNPQWDGAALAELVSSLQAIQPSCAAGPLASGTYYLKNVHSGDVIDIPQSTTTEGTDLDQWPLNDGTNQQWDVTSLGCGLYSIKSALDGESVDISGQSTSNGASVDEYDYWGGGNQQFVIAKDAGGSYTISSVNSLDPVEVPGFSTTAGTLLDQWQANGGTNQEWTFVAG